MSIHQIYCTHCTHGSSALERREGELAHRIFGYSARAASMEAMELRRCYRQIEPYVYYYLPRDTPNEQRLQLTAATAPRRLFFIPSASGFQLLGQVCYRQTDTEGRPGSYFAHVLLQEERSASRRWSALDCLKLWGAARWTHEDSPSIPFLLDGLGGLDDLLAGRPAAIDDRVLWSFLVEPGDALEFYDPAGVVPARWRAMPPETRQRWLMEALAGLMETSPARRESLLVVAEPGLSALLFYGVARLLPGGPIRDGLSYSTFESQTERVCTALAGTWFADPEANGRRGDAGRLRGVTINTLADPASLKPRPSRYAAMMVPLLVERGWRRADEKLDSIRAAGAQRLEDLEFLAGLDQTAAALLAGEAPHGEPWQASPMGTGYLRGCVGQRLAEIDDPPRRLAPVVGTPAHPAVLELAASEPELPGTRRAVEFLLRSLPADRIAPLLQGARVSHENKLLLLAEYVTAHGDLPPGCEGLWHGGLQAADSPRGKPLLLGDLLARLDTRALEQFYQNARAEHGNAFLLALVEASGQKTSKRTALRQIVETLDEPALLSLYRSHGAAFFAAYPDDEPTLGKKLRETLHTLHERPGQFGARLDMLLAGRRLLRDQGDLDLLTAWDQCRQAILEIDRYQNPRPVFAGRVRMTRLASAACQMAESALRAMPRDLFNDNPAGARKQQYLRRIAKDLLDGRELLPRGPWQHEELWRRIAWCFENGWWPQGRLQRQGWGFLLSRPAIAGMALAAAALVVVAVIALRSRGPSRQAAAVAGADHRGATPQNGPVPPSPRPEPKKPPPPVDPPVPKPAPADPPSPPEPAAPKQPPVPPKPPDTSDDPFSKPEEKTAPDPNDDPPGKEEPAAKIAMLPGEEEPPSPAEPPKAKPAEKPRDDHAEWTAWAEPIAKEHSGRLLDRRPMEDGRWQTPAELLKELGEAGKAYRLIGRVQLGPRAADFDTVWQEGRRHQKIELPGLAAEFGLAAVLLKLAPEEEAVRLELDGEPRTKPADAAPQLKKAIDEAESVVQKVRALLKRRVAPGSDEEREVERTVLELLRIQVPSVPPEPKREDPQFKENAKAFDEALRRHRTAKEDRDRIVSNVRKIGETTVRELTQAIDVRTKELNQEKARVSQEYKDALSDLKSQPWTISLLICPDGPALAGIKPPRPAPSPAPPSTPPPVPSPPAAERPRVSGRFEIVLKREQNLRPPAIARIGPLFIKHGPRVLGDWFTQTLLCECRVEPVGGSRPPLAPLSSDARVAEIMEGTTAVRIRLRFHQRGPNAAAPAGPFVGETEAYVQKIERGNQYTVVFSLDNAGLDQLREASGVKDGTRFPELHDNQPRRR